MAIPAGDNQAMLPRGTQRFGYEQDPDVEAGTQFKKGQSGNPAGRKKGRNLSKVIQDLLDDDGFIDRLAAALPEGAIMPDEDYQGTPIMAIVSGAVLEAMDPSSKPAVR